ncbi:MAG TPA: hypothetical protein VHI13_06180 [Candidatus Kapabacteria bacterium]|nr:hypothetical protein [Candidatus Kapabacteria bacterium]
MPYSRTLATLIFALIATQLDAQGTDSTVAIRFPARFAAAILRVSAATDANGADVPMAFQPGLRYRRMGIAITGRPIRTDAHRFIRLHLTARTTIASPDTKSWAAAGGANPATGATVDSMQVPPGHMGAGSVFREMPAGRMEAVDAEEGTVPADACTIAPVAVRARDTCAAREYMVSLRNIDARTILLRLAGERRVAPGLESQCSAPVASAAAGTASSAEKPALSIVR